MGTAEKPAEALIPFSSDIKFNLIIRDMNKKEKNSTNIDDNMFVYLKGAPERVLGRCSTMLTKGGIEVPLDKELLSQVE